MQLFAGEGNKTCIYVDEYDRITAFEPSLYNLLPRHVRIEAVLDKIFDNLANEMAIVYNVIWPEKEAQTPFFSSPDHLHQTNSNNNYKPSLYIGVSSLDLPTLSTPSGKIYVLSQPSQPAHHPTPSLHPFGLPRPPIPPPNHLSLFYSISRGGYVLTDCVDNDDDNDYTRLIEGNRRNTIEWASDVKAMQLVPDGEGGWRPGEIVVSEGENSDEEGGHDRMGGKVMKHGANPSGDSKDENKGDLHHVRPKKKRFRLLRPLLVFAIGPILAIASLGIILFSIQSRTSNYVSLFVSQYSLQANIRAAWSDIVEYKYYSEDLESIFVQRVMPNFAFSISAYRSKLESRIIDRIKRAREDIINLIQKATYLNVKLADTKHYSFNTTTNINELATKLFDAYINTITTDGMKDMTQPPLPLNLALPTYFPTTTNPFYFHPGTIAFTLLSLLGITISTFLSLYIYFTRCVDLPSLLSLDYLSPSSIHSLLSSPHPPPSTVNTRTDGINTTPPLAYNRYLGMVRRLIQCRDIHRAVDIVFDEQIRIEDGGSGYSGIGASGENEERLMWVRKRRIRRKERIVKLGVVVIAVVVWLSFGAFYLRIIRSYTLAAISGINVAVKLNDLSQHLFYVIDLFGLERIMLLRLFDTIEGKPITEYYTAHSWKQSPQADFFVHVDFILT